MCCQKASSEELWEVSKGRDLSRTGVTELSPWRRLPTAQCRAVTAKLGSSSSSKASPVGRKQSYLGGWGSLKVPAPFSSWSVMPDIESMSSGFLTNPTLLKLLCWPIYRNCILVATCRDFPPWSPSLKCCGHHSFKRHFPPETAPVE